MKKPATNPTVKEIKAAIFLIPVFKGTMEMMTKVVIVAAIPKSCDDHIVHPEMMPRIKKAYLEFLAFSRGEVRTHRAKENNRRPGKIRMDKPDNKEAMEPIYPSRVGNCVTAVNGITMRIAGMRDL